MTIQSTTTRVLIVGGNSGIARALAVALVGDGTAVFLAGRDPERLRAALDPSLRDRVETLRIDLDDETTIATAAADLGPLDFVVSVAASHANGPVTGLERGAITAAFDAKVIGPLLLAKYLADSVRPGGGFVFLSGVAAWRPAAGLSVMATTNGAVAFLAEALAVELAPVRVVAVSPGIIDSGAWDGMGAEQKQTLFAETAASNPVRRVGATDDVVSTIRYAMDNTFVTGTTLHVDGGGRLA